MNDKIRDILSDLRRVEEDVVVNSFDPDNARYHTRLIKQLKEECLLAGIDPHEVVKGLPLGKWNDAFLETEQNEPPDPK